MNKTNLTIANTKGMSKLERAKFGPGMLLQHEDLGALNEYTRELSRLMFRSLFGCGVVCGLAVKAEVDNCNKVSVIVGAGLALDCAGDPVYVPNDQRLLLDGDCYPDLPDKLWIVLCGTTKNCAPRTSMCASDDDEPTSVCTRERDMFEIKVLSARTNDACGCDESTYPSPREKTRSYCWCSDPIPDCHVNHYAGECGCSCGDGSTCDCECILLARLDKDAESNGWTVDHRVRRFVRPVLMRDPEVRPPQEHRNSSDVAALREQLAMASADAAQATEAVEHATMQVKSAAMIQGEKSALARMAEEKYAEAKAASESAKTAAEKRRTASALDEASAAARLARVEADKAATDATDFESAWRKAIEERLVRNKAVADVTDNLVALTEELEVRRRNQTR